jgi:hypothetical protein
MMEMTTKSAVMKCFRRAAESRFDQFEVGHIPAIGSVCAARNTIMIFYKKPQSN